MITHSPYHFFEHDIYFVVYTPAYERTSGGVHAMHCLAEDMYAMGCKVGVLANKGMIGARVPLIDPAHLMQVRSAGMRLVAIYPEILTENVLQADYVVWWLLNYPGFIKNNWSGGYDWADRIVSFGGEVGKNCPWHAQLRYPLYDTGFFFPNPDIAKSEIVYYANRILALKTTLTTPVQPTVVLTHKEPLTYTQMRSLFWKTKLILTHEWSGTMTMAQLCGVPVIFLESPLLTRDMQFAEGLLHGSAWGYSEENIALARKSLSNVRQINLDRQQMWLPNLASEVATWIQEAKRKS